jgi:hypothetical protein
MFNITRQMASKFQRVFVWCDEPKRARKYRDLLPNARLLKSPKNIANVDKWDANEMLKRGELANILAYVLGVDCLGVNC